MGSNKLKVIIHLACMAAFIVLAMTLKDTTASLACEVLLILSALNAIRLAGMGGAAGRGGQRGAGRAVHVGR